MNTEELKELGMSEELAGLALAAFEEVLAEKTRQMEEEHAAALRSIALENAMGLALSDAHDVGLAAGLIDRNALTVEDDGSVTGLTEQVQALREAKPFLFRGAAAPGFRLGVSPASGVSEAYGGSLTLRDVIAGRFHAQRG